MEFKHFLIQPVFENDSFDHASRKTVIQGFVFLHILRPMTHSLGM